MKGSSLLPEAFRTCIALLKGPTSWPDIRSNPFAEVEWRAAKKIAARGAKAAFVFPSILEMTASSKQAISLSLKPLWLEYSFANLDIRLSAPIDVSLLSKTALNLESGCFIS